MNQIAQILTPWDTAAAGTEEDPVRPLVASSQPLDGWQDVTCQQAIPPAPNLLVVQLRCSAEVLEAIRNDPNYLILWEKEQ